MLIWPLMPSARETSSVRKPFITLITMISVATPSAMPTSEKTGDHRNEALAPARPQITAGNRAFEGVEHRRSGDARQDVGDA